MSFCVAQRRQLFHLLGDHPRQSISSNRAHQPKFKGCLFSAGILLQRHSDQGKATDRRALVADHPIAISDILDDAAPSAPTTGRAGRPELGGQIGGALASPTQW